MNDDELKQNIKKSMDEVVDAIDVSTQVKLNAARHAALHQSNNKRWLPKLSMAGVAVAVILTVTLVWFQAPIDGASDQTETLWLEDLDLLATEAEPEFYQDLEFLAWLEENQLLDSEI